jgi:uncharacterized protein YbjT (DUF2867 family)
MGSRIIDPMNNITNVHPNQHRNQHPNHHTNLDPNQHTNHHANLHPNQHTNLDPSQHTNPMNPMERTTLVIGATGKTGRRVVERLRAACMAVKEASRSSEVHFDWEQPSTWEPAFDGVDAAYITYYPDLALPGAAEAVGALADVALSQGVRRLVLLAGRGEHGAQKAEERLQSTDADWTIVRCGFFAQNFSEMFADPIRHGVMALPDGSGSDPLLDVDDIADVVVKALQTDDHIGRLYELTGPRVMTLDEVAATLTGAVGRNVQYVSMSRADYTNELVQAGIPDESAAHITEVIVDALDGRNAWTTNDVELVLGRPARDFTEFARDAAAAGAWALSA